MSNHVFVILVSYIGLCIGTFIRTGDFNTNMARRIGISVIAPIPVLVTLIWAATSIAIEKYRKLSDCYEYPMLLAMSLAMYADAVMILTRIPKRATRKRIVTYRYRFPMIKKVVATNYAA